MGSADPCRAGVQWVVTLFRGSIVVFDEKINSYLLSAPGNNDTSGPKCQN
jgi:hypothetical protein